MKTIIAVTVIYVLVFITGFVVGTKYTAPNITDTWKAAAIANCVDCTKICP